MCNSKFTRAADMVDAENSRHERPSVTTFMLTIYSFYFVFYDMIICVLDYSVLHLTINEMYAMIIGFM